MWVHMFRIKHSRDWLTVNFVASTFLGLSNLRFAGFERRFNKFGIDRNRLRSCADILFGLSFSVVEWFQEHFLQHSLVRCVARYGDPCVGLFNYLYFLFSDENFRLWWS